MSLPDYRGMLEWILWHKLFVAVTFCFSIYCLFGREVETIAFGIEQTPVFDAITLSAFALFTVEIVLSWTVLENYPLSLLFFLDIISAATLILHVSFVESNWLSGAQSQAARASVAGARATRVIGTIRLVRLLRVFKIFVVIVKGQQREHQSSDSGSGNVSSLSHIEERFQSESRMGKGLSRVTSKRMVFAVLLVIVLVPLLELDAEFATKSDIHLAGLKDISDSYLRSIEACRAANSTLAERARIYYERTLLNYVHQGCNSVVPCPRGEVLTRIAWIGASSRNLSDPCVTGVNSPAPYFNWIQTDESGDLETLVSLLSKPWSSFDSAFLTVHGISLLPTAARPTGLRQGERSVISRVTDYFIYEIVVDLRAYARSEAFLSIYRTIAVLIILSLGSYAFCEDAFDPVLAPIRRMISRVDKIRENPLEATRSEEESINREESERIRLLARYKTASSYISKWRAKRELAMLRSAALETARLENTKVRIGGLLALGFGQAGADIVAHNIKSNDFEINAMLPGKKIAAIFLTVKVKDFEVISGALKNKVLNFVNQMAEIVHGITDEYNGVPNKIDGGSFFIVWRLPQDPDETAQVHDMAATACAKMCIAVRRSLELHAYRSLPPLIQRIPGFRVQLLFGLHSGWGIEGAIGSNLKIDPSYLGPDRLLSDDLASCNLTYETTIMASGSFVNSCSRKLAGSLFRRIDHVKLKTMRQPLYLFSLDIDQKAELLTQYEISNNELHTRSLNTTRSRQRKEREKRKMKRWNCDLLVHLLKDPHFLTLRFSIERNPIWKELFSKAFLNFESGEWEVAKAALKATLAEYKADDGPSASLMKYMRTYKFASPAGWPGWRDQAA